MDIMGILKIIIIPLALAVGGLFYIFKPEVKQDNPIEEIFEVFILEVTGEDIDISPLSPEFEDEE